MLIVLVLLVVVGFASFYAGKKDGVALEQKAIAELLNARLDTVKFFEAVKARVVKAL
jgi:hypothetical protein